MLIAKLIWELQAKVINVETAFLHGGLQEEIYMKVSEGMQHDTNKCLLLKKTIYGRVQNPREFYNKLLSALKLMGFVENKSDSYLLSKWTSNGIVLIGIYVDDCSVIGKDEQIKRIIDDLEANGFNLKIERNLKDCLSCCAIENVDSKTILILHLHLINNSIWNLSLEMKFVRIDLTELLALQDSKVEQQVNDSLSV